MPGEWLSYVPTVADWASILSLFVSAYAAYTIARVRAQVVDRARLPTLAALLEKHAKKFATLMLSYDEPGGADEFAVELARCEANVYLVRSKLSRNRRNRVSSLLREIGRYKRPRWFGYYPAIASREQAWRIYTDLNGLIEELRNLLEELRMGA